MRRKILALLVALSIAVVLHPSAANATSAYDNAYSTTDNLWLGEDGYYGVNCPFEDVTYSMDELIGDQSNWQSSTDYNVDWPIFEEAKDNGSWAYSQYRHVAGGGESRQLWVVYTPTPGDIYWADTNNVRASGDDLIMLQITTNRVYYGYGDCKPLIIAYEVSEQDISRNGLSYAPQFTENYVAVNWDVTYPDAFYGGTLVRTSPPTPTTSPITGTVDCGGENPSLMTIAQAGNNGAATLTYVSLGISEWSYDLRTDVPYSFNVLCGTKLAAPFGAVSATTSSNLWTCDIYGPEPWYCVLS